MGAKPKIIPVSLGLLALLVLGAIQGARIDGMRDTETFYRWVVGAALQSRLGATLEPNKAPNEPEPMDDELFAKVLELAEARLPDLPTEEDDFDYEGNPHPVLLRAARQEEDDLIYDLVASSEATPLREEFFTHLKAGLLQSGGTQFTTASLYDPETQVEGVGLTSLFFGFRKVAANFLWMQVDTYWHTGELHRMVPMMRTTVTLDPNFVDAYLLGSWHLAYNITAKLPVTPEPMKKFHPKYRKRLGVKEEWYYIATDFLKDGIRKNPRDYRLYFDLGYAIYENKIKDHANAVRYLNEARRYKHDQWVPRMLYLAMWRNGQYEEAIAGWEEYLDLFPDSHQAVRFIQINMGYLAEANAKQAEECQKAAAAAAERFAERAKDARSAGDLQQGSELDTEARVAREFARDMGELAEKHWEDSRQVWIPMIQTNGDSIAAARLLQQTANQYVKEGRYMEAIAEMQLARYEMLESFDELSDLMIEIKQQGGMPLTVSEKLSVERKKEAALYEEEDAPKPRRYISCEYIDTN